MISWQNLETMGYLLVRGFLSPDLVELMAADFHKGPAPREYPYGFKPVRRRALAAVMPRVEDALSEVRRHTRLRVDSVNFLTVSHYVTTELAEHSSHLHQDFDLDYRLTQNHFDYLNFWIPIVKPCRRSSNLDLVPMTDDLAPLRGAGGHRLESEEGRTTVYTGQAGDELRMAFELDCDLETRMVTPELEVGDLLLLRGDVPHRTQDRNTLRVAVSIRATGSHKFIERERALKAEADQNISRLLHRFFEGDRQRGTVAEFLAFARGG